MSDLANVTIVSKAWSDLRFVTLARLLGLADATAALIRCARLWAYQTTTFTQDAPTYAISAGEAEDAIGLPGAAAALVKARLAEEQPDPGGETVYRIKGTHGRIEWFHRLTKNAPRGAEAARRNRAHDSGPAGLPAGMPDGLAPSERNTDDVDHPAGVPAGCPIGTPGGLPAGGPSLLFTQRSDLSADLDPPGRSDLSGPASQTKPRKKPAKALPDNWKPREQDNALKGEQLAHELARFRDHARAKDWRMVDWDATWRNWQRTAAERAPRYGPRPNATYGASKPRTDHPTTPAMRPASEVL